MNSGLVFGQGQGAPARRFPQLYSAAAVNPGSLDLFAAASPQSSGYNVQQLVWTQHFWLYQALIIVGVMAGIGAAWLPDNYINGLLLALIVAHYLLLIVFAVAFREPPQYMLQQRLFSADPTASDRQMLHLT